MSKRPRRLDYKTLMKGFGSNEITMCESRTTGCLELGTTYCIIDDAQASDQLQVGLPF